MPGHGKCDDVRFLAPARGICVVVVVVCLIGRTRSVFLRGHGGDGIDVEWFLIFCSLFPMKLQRQVVRQWYMIPAQGVPPSP